MLRAVLGNYGLGFSLAGNSFSHGGSNEGFRCTLHAYRDSGRGAVVMTNGDRGGALAREMLAAVAAEYGWPDFKPRERAAVAVDARVLSGYAGSYQFVKGPLVTVTVEGGKLYVQGPQIGRVELTAESETAFFSQDGGAPDLRFTKKDDGPVELSAGGGTAKRM